MRLDDRVQPGVGAVDVEPGVRFARRLDAHLGEEQHAHPLVDVGAVGDVVAQHERLESGKFPIGRIAIEVDAQSGLEIAAARIATRTDADVADRLCPPAKVARVVLVRQEVVFERLPVFGVDLEADVVENGVVEEGVGGWRRGGVLAGAEQRLHDLPRLRRRHGTHRQPRDNSRADELPEHENQLIRAGHGAACESNGAGVQNERRWAM